MPRLDLPSEQPNNTQPKYEAVRAGKNLRLRSVLDYPHGIEISLDSMRIVCLRVFLSAALHSKFLRWQ